MAVRYCSALFRLGSTAKSNNSEAKANLFKGWAVATNPIDQIDDGATKIAYVRWIPEHSDVLIARIIGATPLFDFVDLDAFRGQDGPALRRELTQASEREPVRYRRILLQKILALRSSGVKAVVLTLDWTAPLREIVFACRSVGITTILVPHESVFSTPDTYYVQKRRKTNAPMTDYVLCWGGLQEQIFLNRGYPSDRLIKVGSPKLDFDVTYEPILSNSQYREIFGLGEGGKIIVFAMQPMDNYDSKRSAREDQARAISDVLAYCEERGHQLVVRTPPSRDEVIPTFLSQKLNSSPNIAVDIAGEYVLTPEETIAHADLVVSVNSTMLFEARLMGKPSIGMRYIDLPSIWSEAGIPMVLSRLEFSMVADKALAADGGSVPKASEWAEAQFSNPDFGFDGKSLLRIRDKLEAIVKAPGAPLALDVRGFANPAVGPVFYPSSVVVTDGLLQQYGAETLQSILQVEAVFKAATPYNAAAGDLFVGSPETLTVEFEKMRKSLGRPLRVLDDSEIAARAEKLAPAPERED
ncbi:hypothetical protein HGO38_07140 [Rhizobium sp. CG5]|uniref:hypothetical protein n=1 Tax=Rhizobium sp. CG5 TaxID=2726076 RepID=UPI0020340840|nr:hypothetical protein [Rhizobium sp. CG5]MCM2473252.1 hypothetical protein [Rhizobium sp. CG5]